MMMEMVIAHLLREIRQKVQTIDERLALVRSVKDFSWQPDVFEQSVVESQNSPLPLRNDVFGKSRWKCKAAD